MTHYGARSRASLATLHPDIQKILLEVDRFWAHGVLEGERSDAQQAENVAKGVSQTTESKHLRRCSADPDAGVDAADIAPDPLEWPQLDRRLGDLGHLMERLAVGGLTGPERQRLLQEIRDALTGYAKELGRWYYFKGYVLATADQMHRHGEVPCRLRGGEDWNGNRQVDDQRFDDLPHIERVPD